MAQPSDVNVDDLRRRARRRLVGAIVLALSAAVFVPMLLESEPKPLGEDVSVKIPPVDSGKFVNKLNAKGGAEASKAAPKPDPARPDAAKAAVAKVEAPKVEAPVVEPAATASPVLASGSGASTTAPGRNAAPSPPEAAAAPKRSLAEAEQKVLAAPASKAGTPAAPAAAKSPAASSAVPAAAAPVVPASAPAVATRNDPTKVDVPGVAASKADAPKADAPKADAPKAEATSVGSDSPGFSVQLAAFSDDKGANSLANKLKKAGYVAYTEPLTTPSGAKLWRVRVGPFPSRDAAGAVRDKLKGDGYSGIVAPAK